VVPTTIDYSMGFANHANLVNNGSALFTNTVARLTDGQNNQAGSIFTNAKFDITRFTTSFTFVLTGTNPIADGITFTIENDPAGAAALGFSGGGVGYGAGLARTLGNLGNLAPCLCGSYTILRGVSCHDSRRISDGEDSTCLLGRGHRLL